MAAAMLATAAAVCAADDSPAPAASPSGSPVAIKAGGKTYHDVEFISTTGETVIFESDDGPVVVKWNDLPPDIRKRFTKDYDDSLKQQQASVVSGLGVAQFRGQVVAKLPKGFIASWGETLVMLTGYPDEASLQTGQTISVNAQRTGSYPYTDASGKTKIIRRFKVLSVPEKFPMKSNAP